MFSKINLSVLVIVAFVVSFMHTAKPADAKTFRIGHHRAVMGSVGAVANRMGYFDKTFGKGNYTVKQFPQGKLMRQAILANSLDVGGAADRAFLSAISKKAKVKGIFNATYWCKSNKLLTSPKSSIKTLKDLKGKKLGIGKATGSYFTLRTFILPKYGMSTKDFTTVNMNTDTRMSALKTGIVQMIGLNNPQAAIAIERGFARTVETYCRYANNLWIMMANARTLSSDRAGVVKYVRGYIKGMKLHRDNNEKFARTYHTHLTSKGGKVSFSVVKASVNDIDFGLYPSEKDYKWFDYMGKVLLKLKKAKRIVDLRSEGMDLSVTKEAAKAEGYK